MTKSLFVIASAVLVTACSDAARMSPVAPTSVIPVATPPPSVFAYVFQEPYTDMTVGSTVQRTVDRRANPDCVGVPGYGCQYFRITPDRDGMLDVEVTWVPETQPNQGLDLTIDNPSTGREWADVFGVSATALTTRVRAGETSQIIVWYTFPGIEFSLQALLHPN